MQLNLIVRGKCSRLAEFALWSAVIDLAVQQDDQLTHLKSPLVLLSLWSLWSIHLAGRSALLADHGCCDDDPSIGGLFNTLHSNLLSIEFLLSSSSSTSFFHQIEFDFLTSLSCCG